MPLPPQRPHRHLGTRRIYESGQAFEEVVQQGHINVEGDPASGTQLFGLLDDVSPTFEIVEPKPEI